jgi:RNA polymerase sigma-70 factor, ECF subfamily
LELRQFEELFRTYYTDCVRFAYSYIENAAGAEDIVQQVFLKLWEKKEEIHIHTAPKSYLLTAVRNTAISAIRKTTASVGVDTAADITGSPSVTIETRQLEEEINKAVNSLPEKCREIFLLSRQQQLTYKEIAATLEIAEKTVENQMGKALKILHQHLDKLLFIIVATNYLYKAWGWVIVFASFIIKLI